MDEHSHPGPTVLIITSARLATSPGASWCRRLYNLYWTNGCRAVCGDRLDMKEMQVDEFHQRLRDGVDRFSRRGKADDKAWDAMAPSISYICGDLGDPAVHKELAKRLADQEREWNTHANSVFYLAVPPVAIEAIVHG